LTSYLQSRVALKSPHVLGVQYCLVSDETTVGS